MAIIGFYEVTGSRSGSINSSWEREYSRRYLAVSNSVDDHEAEVFQHPACPVLNKAPPWDNLSQCNKLEAKLRPKSGNGKWRWEVSAGFSSVQLEAPKSDNPLDDPAKIEISTELVSEEGYLDVDGNPMMNTAGTLIKSPVEIPRSDIQISKNISIYSGWLKNIAGIVNNSPVRIKGILWETGTLKVVSVHIGDTEYRNKTAFMVAKVTMRHKAEGWETTTLNMGYYELRPDPTGRIIDKSGQVGLVRHRCLTMGTEGEPENQPVFLDKNGKRPTVVIVENGIRKEIPKCPLEPKDIVVLRFKRFRPFDFKRLPLG